MKKLCKNTKNDISRMKRWKNLVTVSILEFIIEFNKTLQVKQLYSWNVVQKYFLISGAIVFFIIWLMFKCIGAEKMLCSILYNQ